MLNLIKVKVAREFGGEVSPLDETLVYLIAIQDMLHIFITNHAYNIIAAAI